MNFDTLKKPSLTTRVGVGKLAGFIVGLSAFVFLPFFVPETSPMLRWAFLFWYTTLGAVIGVYGVFSFHPVLDLPFPWWIRATVIGAWFNLVLLLFIYDQMTFLMASIAAPFSGFLTSPLWFVVEGGIVGLLIGWVCTWAGGEGPETVNFRSAGRDV